MKIDDKNLYTIYREIWLQLDEMWVKPHKTIIKGSRDDYLRKSSVKLEEILINTNLYLQIWTPIAANKRRKW